MAKTKKPMSNARLTRLLDKVQAGKTKGTLTNMLGKKKVKKPKY
jgi:hypothetical protein